MPKPRLLDLFSGAGGAAAGYAAAGFEVIGVDIHPQPNYPFEFHQADALEFLGQHWQDFDAFHASPPCQGYGRPAALPNVPEYPKLVSQVGEIFRTLGRPYVIENVLKARAEMQASIMLCGQMFGLQVFWHRYFEVRPWMLGPGHPAHPRGSTTNAGRGYSSFENGATHICPAGNNFKRADGAKAMGIQHWMNRPELAQAIPPAYTEYIGKHLIKFITQKKEDNHEQQKADSSLGAFKAIKDQIAGPIVPGRQGR